MAKWLDKLTRRKPDRKTTVLQSLIAGSLYKVSDMRGETDLSTIGNIIQTMRALANDSQIATALSYYATDATTPNSSGQILWATPKEPDFSEAADILNEKFVQWNINAYARDHILELATVGNLYIPTTRLYAKETSSSKALYGLDTNTVVDENFEIVPSYKLDPSETFHFWFQGKDLGYAYQRDEDSSTVELYPPESIIHFTLGGLLGEYTYQGRLNDGEEQTFDIQFGNPLMFAATQPTQTLGLLEDAVVLSSLSRMVRFINVDCGVDEEEISATLQQLKSMIEQQLSINTATADSQSFVNPQSPNNLIYLPKVNGNDPISITDLNMAEVTDADNKLLEYYQNKKLSVLGVPKEAMNFSSAEGLGGAGAVMSQRSALYANSLQRLETAYKDGWTRAANCYFRSKGLSGFVDKFDLHMSPILTQLSTVNFERRDSAVSQAAAIVQLLKDLGVTDADSYKTALTEILLEALPATGSAINNWKVDVEEPAEGGAENAF